MKQIICSVSPRLTFVRKCSWILLATTLIGSTAPGFAGNPAKAASSFERKGAQQLLEATSTARAPRGLPSELDIPELSGLARDWEAQPKTTQFVTTVRDDVSARVAVHEVGTGSRVVVCLHGLFGQSSNWKYVAGALGQDHQLWLMDLPGCGVSDNLKAGKNNPDAYCPQSLAARVLQTLEARLAARPDVTRVVIAGHSLGGMIVLRMFADAELRERYATVLAKVDGLVLFAPSDVVVTQATEDWLAMLSLNATKVRIGDTLGLLQSAMNKSIRSSFCDPSMGSRELSEEGRQMLKNGPQRRATQAMMRSALPWREFGEQLDWPAVEALEAGYQNIRVPCLIVWGQRDKTLPAAMGYKMKDQLPDARLVVVPQSMHLLPLERPGVCAELIRNFDRQLLDGALPVARSVTTLPRESVAMHTLIAGSPSTVGAPAQAAAGLDNAPVESILFAR